MAPNTANPTNYGHDGYKVAVMAILLIIMQLLMITGRLVSRRIQKVKLGADDYTLISATIFSTVLCALPLAFPRIATFTPASLPATPRGLSAGQASLAFQVLYALSVLLSKAALLLLYLRVFTAQMKKFTLTLSIVGFVIVTSSLAYTFIAVFQCAPVSFAWDRSLQNGRCIDFAQVARWLCVPNVVDGLVMLLMPLPVVWALAIETQQKVALTATFFHGIVGFVASLVRLAYLSRTTPLTPTSSLTLTIFTLLEPSNYIIAACLPTLRPIFTRILPDSFFILSRKRASQSPPQSPTAVENGKKSWASSTVKWSWSRGSLTPKIGLVSRGASQLSGPWDGSRWEGEEGFDRVGASGKGKEGEGVRVWEEEVGVGAGGRC